MDCYQIYQIKLHRHRVLDLGRVVDESLRTLRLRAIGLDIVASVNFARVPCYIELFGVFTFERNIGANKDPSNHLHRRKDVRE